MCEQNPRLDLYSESFTREHREEGESYLLTESLGTQVSQAGFGMEIWRNMRVLGPSEGYSCVPEKVQRHHDETLDSSVH